MPLLLKRWFDLASGSPEVPMTIYLLGWDSHTLPCPSSRTVLSALGTQEGPAYCYSLSATNSISHQSWKINPSADFDVF